jgi:hypothetical protein
MSHKLIACEDLKFAISVWPINFVDRKDRVRDFCVRLFLSFFLNKMLNFFGIAGENFCDVEKGIVEIECL